MTDFFANLVTRSFSTVQAIRPRLGSLYEPTRDNAPSLDAAPERGNQSSEYFVPRQETSATREIQHLDPVTSPGRSPRITLTNAEPEKPGASEIASRFVAHDAAFDRNRLTFRKPIHTDSGSEVGDEEEGASQEHRSDSSKVGTPLISKADEIASREIASTMPSSRRSEKQTQRLRVTDDEYRGRLVPPDARPETQLEQLALSVRLDNRMRAQQIASPATVSQPEPDIHVTIGRIEVRATKETSRPARNSQVSPVTSLDEYLRTHAARRQ